MAAQPGRDAWLLQASLRSKRPAPATWLRRSQAGSLQEPPCPAREDDEQGGDPSSERREREALFWRDRPCWSGGLRLSGDADLQRINPDRIGDVLELSVAEVGDRQIKPSLDLSIGVLRKTDRPRRGNALKPGGDVDAVAHQIAVAFLDHVAQVNSDPELDSSLGRHTGVALGHAVLHFDRAAHGVDDAAELDEDAVAGALYDASVMSVDSGIDQIAAQPPQPRQRATLVRPREPAVADDVGDQDRGDFPGSLMAAPQAHAA